MNVDLKKRPKDADFWISSSAPGYEGSWVKLVDGQWFACAGGDAWRPVYEPNFAWLQYQGILVYKALDLERVLWDGEGFPPVGTVCEIETIRQEWVRVVVVAITDYRIYCEQVGNFEGGTGPSEFCPVKQFARLRPLRKPEHVATEEFAQFMRDALACVEKNSGTFNESLLENRTSAIEATIAALYAGGYRSPLK